MRRVLLLSTIAIALGAVTLYVATKKAPPPLFQVDAPLLAGVATPESPRESRKLELADLITESLTIGEQAALYELAARSDRPAPDTLARRVAALPVTGGTRFALDVLLARYAEIDPRAAVKLAHDLEVPIASIASLYRSWARLYVLDLEPTAQESALHAGGLQAFAQVDPARAFDVAQRLPGDIAQMVRRLALMNVSRDDPLSAVQYAESLPLGAERNEALSTIATGYARVDPEAALAWVQSLQPPAAPGLLANVLAGLARVDPERAIDLAFSMGREQTPALQMLVMNGALEARHTAEIADRLLAMPARRSMLLPLTTMWAQREPEAALEWLIANSEHAPNGSFAAAGARLARRDPAAAIAYLARIPIEQRSTWLASVADGYAQNDPRASATWIAQYRGQPGYDAAVARITERTARHDPVAAARLYETIEAALVPGSTGAALAIASQWSRQDPRAAADWVADLDDDDVRWSAVDSVAWQWSTRDPPAARAWTLSLPSGPDRDVALGSVLGSLIAETGSVEPTLANAFSSDSARQQGLVRAVMVVAQRDAAAAQRLADDYLTDPDARQEAERMIAQAKNAPPRPFAPGSGALAPPPLFVRPASN